MSHDGDLFREVLEKASAYDTYGEATVGPGDDPTTVVETTDEAKEPVSAEGGTTSSVTLINLFRTPDAHPVVLDLALLRKYNIDWLSWERETLELRISEDFRTPTISEANMHKVQAMKTLHLVDTFWTNWEVFQMCCSPLNGIYPDAQIMQAPTVAQCMLAVDIANRVREDVVWSDEMKAYLAVVHRHDQILCPQRPLQFVKVDTEGLPVDCEEIMRLWPMVRAGRAKPKAATITGEQLSRMLLVHEYLEDARAQLQRQVQMIRHV
jgi:hypothetical protein